MTSLRCVPRKSVKTSRVWTHLSTRSKWGRAGGCEDFKMIKEGETQTLFRGTGIRCRKHAAGGRSPMALRRLPTPARSSSCSLLRKGGGRPAGRGCSALTPTCSRNTAQTRFLPWLQTRLLRPRQETPGRVPDLPGLERAHRTSPPPSCRGRRPGGGGPQRSGAALQPGGRTPLRADEHPLEPRNVPRK